MDNIINMARELGRALQDDERYIKLKVLEQNMDEDKDLQELLGEFNLKRLSINNETSKEERDDKKIEDLNGELRSCYTKIINNDIMGEYNEAKKEIETLLKNINMIILKCAQGEDPQKADYQNSCSGGCSDCSGCH